MDNSAHFQNNMFPSMAWMRSLNDAALSNPVPKIKSDISLSTGGVGLWGEQKVKHVPKKMW